MDLNLNIVKYFAHKLGIDKAISYTLLTQIFGILRSLVVIILVTKFLTATEQGFSYTFGSILAIQVFFELGFSGIITQYAAYERANLTWQGNILEGDEMYQSRLNSLLHLTAKWFSVMTFLLFVTLLVGGFAFFYYFSPKYEDVNWQLPWILMATTTALNLFVSPALAFYEGLGKVDRTAKLRFYSLFFTTVVFFIALCLNTKLYAFAFNSIAGLIVNIVWLFSPSIRETFTHVFHYEIRKYTISWREEIFPYQWKIALSWMSGYFLFQLFNPILFSTVGAKAAGQMGMTQAALGGIFALANSWFSTKVPLFSNLISLKKYTQLDNLFAKTIKQALIVMTGSLFVLFVIIGLVNYLKYNIGGRFLEPLPFIILGLSSVILFTTGSLGVYLRCHKEEPFLILSLVSGSVNALLLYFTSKYFGITGMVCGYFVVMLISLIGGYNIFINKKKVWHDNQ